MKLSKYLLSFLVALSSFTAMAQIPETQYLGETPYISGGIGSDESDAIQAESKKWPLMLQFSQVDEKGWGSWISGVKVRIQNNQKQEVFTCICEGPFLLVGLKPGEYAIEATYNGVAQQKTFSIKAGKLEKLSIYWKQADVAKEILLTKIVP